MRYIRQLLLGLISGLTGAGLLLVLVNYSSPTVGEGITAEQLGSIVSVVFAGLLIGGSYVWLFRSVRDDHVGNLVRGLTLGLITWVLLELNIYPALRLQNPIWTVSEVIKLFPTFIAYLWQGSLIGLIYSLLYSGLAKRLGLEESAPSLVGPGITTRVVILGGGYAGVNAAQTLERELAHEPNVGIWLVSETNYLLHTPMLSEVSASAINAQHVSPALRSFFRQVQVVQGIVDRVDLGQKIVHLGPDARSSRRELPFDHLVLALGSVPDFFGNHEVEAQAFTFKSLEDAVLLRNQVIDMFERADFEQDEVERRRMLTFVVAGGGFAGVELIGSLNDFAWGMLPYYPNIKPEELRLVLVHRHETILPELSDPLSNYAQEKLEERGIEFKLGVHVTGTKPGQVFLEDDVLSTETLVWTTGNKASSVLESLGLPLTQQGQIEVNTELAVPDVPGLWAAGDCAQIPDLSTGKFCPPTAQHAVREGKVLGYNVAASIKNKALRTFRYKTLGSLAALGYQLAVAEIMGHCFSGFLAWLMWRSIYLFKLPTFEKQVRVGLDWLLDVFFPPDIVQTVDLNKQEDKQ